MPNFTPNFNLPYPASTDAPCDFDEQWCDFTEAIDTVLDSFQATVSRTTSVIPIAKMARDTDVGIDSSGDINIPFTDVVVDTAGWVDFDAAPALISPDTGRVHAVVGVMQLEPKSANTRNSASIRSLSSDSLFLTETDILDKNTVPSAGNVTQQIFSRTTPYVKGVTGIPLGVLPGAPGPTIVESASLAVFWFADGS